MTPLRWTTLLLFTGSLVVIWPLWAPLLLAAWTAALLRPALARASHVLHGRRKAAALLSMLVFMGIALPFIAVSVGVYASAKELWGVVQKSPTARKALEAVLAPDAKTKPIDAPHPVSDAANLIQKTGTEGVGFLSDLAGATAEALVGLLIFFGGAYSLLVHSGESWKWLKDHSPLPQAHLERFAAAFHETGRGLLVGVGLTCAAQGVAAMIIYLALGVPRAIVLGVITGIASVIPFIGSALVWGPIALGFALTGRPLKAALLAVLGVGVISVIDNVLRPVFSKAGTLNLPVFVVFVGIFGGLAAFGTWGALLGPLILRLAVEAFAITRVEEAQR